MELLAQADEKYSWQYELKRLGYDFDRPLTYVTAGGENFNLECVRKGYSPYFQKYGYPRGYHEVFMDAERAAMRDGLGYGTMPPVQEMPKMWWEVRARQIEMGRDEKRRNNRLIYLPDGLDYEEAVSGAERQEERQVFGEVGGIREADSGTVILKGCSKFGKFL